MTCHDLECLSTVRASDLTSAEIAYGIKHVMSCPACRKKYAGSNDAITDDDIDLIRYVSDRIGGDDEAMEAFNEPFDGRHDDDHR